MFSDSHRRDCVYSRLSISIDLSSAPLTWSLTSRTPGFSVICCSVPLGTLSTLGARGTAGALVVAVDAQPGLNHHHTVVTSVPTVFICGQRGGGQRGWWRERRRRAWIHCHTHQPETCGLQGIVLQICSCSGLVIKSHSWLCFLSGVRHRTSLICRPLPQEREHWEQNQREHKEHGYKLKLSWDDCSVTSFFFRTFHPQIPLPIPLLLTALHSVVNHCGSHSPTSHSWTVAGLSRCAHSLAGATVKSFPVFWTQMMSRRWVPFPHGTLHWKKKINLFIGNTVAVY